MRAQDRAWLKLKLDSLAKTPGAPFTRGDAAGRARRCRCRATSAPSPRWSSTAARRSASSTARRARRRWSTRCSRARSRSRASTGRCRWTVDILNPATGDDFAMFVKECVLPDGSKRPFSVWLSGAYPLEFNGLTKSLSLDMRVIDPAWIGKKLRGLKDLPEAQGDFFARAAGEREAGGAALDARLCGAAADPPLRDARACSTRRAIPRRARRCSGATRRRRGRARCR